ncbi:thiolase family protein [Actinocorallia aurantiaca]|uniref:Thiolase family protein n=1 Tax=Actinocorallia aurantiaca TaxID=46204 RepID=A0ABP6H6Q6_9ACTN
MRRAVIVDAIRSPLGKGRPGGALAGLHPVELLAQLLTGLVERNGIDPGRVDDVVIGNVTQAGEQGGTPARQALLAAGFPVHVPGMTVERKCGSGQQAIEIAAQSIAAGVNDLVIAGGVESMSRVPMGSNRMGADVYGPSVTERFGELVGQGVAAELVARKWGMSRARLDEYALASNERAAHAQARGWFDEEIHPVTTPEGVIKVDESIRPGATLERIAGLAPVFGTEEVLARFPGLEPKVTAASSSQITDGAAVLLLMEEGLARRLGLRPRAAVHASAVVGDDPMLMLTAPIPATKKVLDKAGLRIGDIGVFEVNEAFAPVPIAWQAEIGASFDVLNPVGGAIALGHPLGASGARIMTTMLHQMERTGSRFGLQTMCEAGGMANATILELLTS